MARRPVHTFDFSKSIDNWTKQTEQRIEAVFKLSATELLRTAQRNVPVDTGFLRSSLMVSVNGDVPPATRPQTAPRPGPNIAIVINGAKLGDTIVAGYTANYALYVEYGTYKMAPRRYLGRAVAQWPQIVERVTIAAKNVTLGGFARISYPDDRE